MELLLRVLAVAFGVTGLVYFILSLARTAIINRPSKDPVLLFVKSVTHVLVRGLQWNRGLTGNRSRQYAWYMPIFIITLMVSWFVLVMVAFAALYWAFGAETTLRGALVASGSALSTLGFDTPTTPQGEALGITEGAIGLIIMVFLLSFVPGYQGAVQTRELQVAWLHRRLQGKPTGVRVLLWLQENMAEGDRPAFWGGWEDWFRKLQATHVLAPEVIFTPSVFAGQSWVSCASAMLDAAALYATVIDGRPVESGGAAQMCAQEGIEAIRNVSITVGFAPSQFPSQFPPPSVTRSQFDGALRQLAAAGIKLQGDEDAAWEHFVALRRMYEQPLHFVSAQTATQDYLEFLPEATGPQQSGVAQEA